MLRSRRPRRPSPLPAALLSALVVAAPVVAAPAAGAATPTAPVQVGLFGAQDPTYDGVFRQSLALLAYRAVGQTPPAAAVSWLLGQQCADGGFQSFRASTTTACQKSDPATYSGEDTNSTGLASAALRAVGQTKAADRALAWVVATQDADGGFPYYVGGGSDANSTAIVLLATNAAGRTPSSVQKGGVSAAHYLESLQIGCAGAATDDDGGFAFQDYGTGLVDSDTASVQVTVALSGAALPLAPRTVSTDVPRATCPAATTTPSTTPSPTGSASPAAATATATGTVAAASAVFTPAQLGAGHLARLLDAFGGAVPQYDFNAGKRLSGTVSAGDTAWAALSLAAVGVGRTQLDAALAVLAKQHLTAAVTTGGKTVQADAPGLLGIVALATHAAGGSAATVDAYVARIGATMRTAPATASPSPTGKPLAPTGASPITPVLAVTGVVLVLLGGVAIGSTRRRGAHA